MGLAPSSGFVKPPGAYIQRVPTKMYVGIPPTEYRVGIGLDGMEFTSTEMKMRMKAYDRNVVGWWFQEPISLNLKTDDENWQYTMIENILAQKEIDTLVKWTSEQNTQLLKISSEYEKYDRQTHHFLYDIIALVKAAKELDEENKSFLLKDTNQAINLFHNRLLAEIYSEYKKKGYSVEFTADKRTNDKKPDLKVNGIFSDVKTILTTGKDRKKLIQDFATKLRNDIIEKPEYVEQIERNGSFFIGVWSPVLNSILLASFENKPEFHTVIPINTENKAIFILPSQTAFQNNYLVFDKNDVCKIMDKLVSDYDSVLEQNAMAYLKLTNIRRGCPLGITGNSISFPINVV